MTGSLPGRRAGRYVLVLTLLVAVAATVHQLTAADHRDAPLITGDASADINDVYSFVSPKDPSRVVLVMTVDPLIPPSDIGKRFFDPDVLYQFKIDTNSDKQEDLVIYAHAEGAGPNQTMRFIGPARPNGTGAVTRGLPLAGNYIGRVPVSFGVTPIVRSFSGIDIFAGIRDDPFFFDLTQFQAIIGGQASGFRDPGVDAFAGFNTLALAIELPSSLLGDSPLLRVWGTTSR